MKRFAPLALLLGLGACGQSEKSGLTAVNAPIVFKHEFADKAVPANFSIFFSDYAANDTIKVPNDDATNKAIAQFTEKHGRAPDALETGFIVMTTSMYLTSKVDQLASHPEVKGLILTQVNRSDDVDTNIAIALGKAEGLLPKTQYIVTGEVEFFSNTPTGGFGIGGAPDAVRYGLSVSPESWTTGVTGGYVRTKNGKAFSVNPFSAKNFAEMGAVNNGISAEEPNANDFALQSLSTMRSIAVTSNADGQIFANFRTHSGFESYSIWAVKSVKLTITKVKK